MADTLAVAFVAGAGDVAATLRFAAAHGLRVAGQGTGHSAGLLPGLDDTILLKTERMRGIEVDPEERLARVEAGVLTAELGQRRGCTGSARCPAPRPTSASPGYTLGGRRCRRCRSRCAAGR